MTRACGARGHVAVSCVDLKLCPAGLLPMLVGGFRQGEEERRCKGQGVGGGSHSDQQMHTRDVIDFV